VTERATLGRSKFCIEEQGFVRAACYARSYYSKLCTTRKSGINRTESGAGAPRSKNFSSNPSQQRRKESVGRAVHCAPVWIVLTRLLEPESLPSAPLRARLRRGTLLVEKKPLTRSTQLKSTTARMAARRNAITAVMVAAVVRRRIKKGYWVFCGFTLGGKVLGRLKYLCFIPDMSSELFRALTSAATVK